MIPKKGAKTRITPKTKSEVMERVRQLGFICECHTPNHRHDSGKWKCSSVLPYKPYFHPKTSMTIISSRDVEAVCKPCADQFRAVGEEIY